MTTSFPKNSEILLNLAKSMFFMNTQESAMSSEVGNSAISFSTNSNNDIEIEEKL